MLTLRCSCHNRLNEIPHQHWADYAFPAPRYGQHTSNLVEQQNFVYLQAREMPVLDMCVYIWEDIQRKAFERLETSQAASGPFSDHINKLYQEQDRSSRLYHAVPSSRSLGLVRSNRDGSQEFRVELKSGGRGSCTCGSFQNNLLPCVHAIAFIHKVNLAPVDYIAAFHHRQAWRQTYLLPLPPILRSSLIADKEVNPPDRKQKRGRPRKKRMEPGRCALRAEVLQEGGDKEVARVDAEPSEPVANVSGGLFQAVASAQPASGATVVAQRPKRAKRAKFNPWVYIVDIPKDISDTAASVSRTRSGRL